MSPRVENIPLTDCVSSLSSHSSLISVGSNTAATVVSSGTLLSRVSEPGYWVVPSLFGDHELLCSTPPCSAELLRSASTSLGSINAAVSYLGNLPPLVGLFPDDFAGPLGS